MNDCLFCKIVSGQIPSDRVYEDDQVIAIRDINPQAPVHVLILPKQHIASVMELTDSRLLGRMMVAAAHVARQARIADRGFRLVTNTGPEGGQAVPHLHLHLLGGRQMEWPPG